MHELLAVNGALSPASTPDQNPLTVYLASLAPTGRRAMAGRLQLVARLLNTTPEALPWHSLRYQHLAAIKAKLQETGQAVSSINLALYALRGVARAAFNLGHMGAEDYQRLRDVKPAKGQRIPKGRALSSGELSAIMGQCGDDQGPAGVRDAAIVGTMYTGGLRRAELVSIDLSDYDRESGALKLNGKGNKQRLVYMTNGAQQALHDWLDVRGTESGPMFVPVNKGGRLDVRRMTEQAVYNILTKRTGKAGVKHASPHDLRRSFASDLLDAGADVVTVQKLMGHANVQTTAGYDRRGEQTKRKAAGLLHIPYRKRA